MTDSMESKSEAVVGNIDSEEEMKLDKGAVYGSPEFEVEEDEEDVVSKEF